MLVDIVQGHPNQQHLSRLDRRISEHDHASRKPIATKVGLREPR